MDKERLKNDAKRIIWDELKGTIPPSIDPMRSLRFERAAERVVDMTIAAMDKEKST